MCDRAFNVLGDSRFEERGSEESSDEGMHFPVEVSVHLQNRVLSHQLSN